MWACWGVGAGRGWIPVQSLKVIKALLPVEEREVYFEKVRTNSGFTPLMMLLANLGKVQVCTRLSAAPTRTLCVTHAFDADDICAQRARPAAVLGLTD